MRCLVRTNVPLLKCVKKKYTIALLSNICVIYRLKSELNVPATLNII